MPSTSSKGFYFFRFFFNFINFFEKIFESVARTLRASEPRSSRFHVTFAPGQSGIEATDLIYTDVPPKHNKVFLFVIFYFKV